MATHTKIFSSADRVLTIRDGSIEEQQENHWVIFVICHNREKEATKSSFITSHVCEDGGAESQKPSEESRRH